MRLAQLGLGLAALGRPGYMTVGHSGDFPDTSEGAMEARTFAVLDRAWALGIRHFDTARSYGLGEAFLARWLTQRAVSPDDVTVSSKWGYRYTAQWQTIAHVHEVKDHSLDHLREQWPQSRALLGPWLRVYQVHSATFDSGILTNAAALDELARLRDEGLTIGLSVTGVVQGDLIDTALSITRGGRHVFGSVQATWNVLEPSSGPALARAHAAGLHTIAKEGVANGRLSSRGDRPDWLELARTHATSPDALALHAALRQPFLDVVLSGAATIEQLDANVKARDLALCPDVRSYAEPPQTYWATRTALPWS